MERREYKYWQTVKAVVTPTEQQLTGGTQSKLTTIGRLQAFKKPKNLCWKTFREKTFFLKDITPCSRVVMLADISAHYWNTKFTKIMDKKPQCLTRETASPPAQATVICRQNAVSVLARLFPQKGKRHDLHATWALKPQQNKIKTDDRSHNVDYLCSV